MRDVPVGEGESIFMNLERSKQQGKQHIVGVFKQRTNAENMDAWT